MCRVLEFYFISSNKQAHYPDLRPSLNSIVPLVWSTEAQAEPLHYSEIDKISKKPSKFFFKSIDLRYEYIFCKTYFGDPGVEQERETRPLVMTSRGPLETTVMWPRAAASPELVSSWVRHEAEEPQNVWGGSLMTSDHVQ